MNKYIFALYLFLFFGNITVAQNFTKADTLRGCLTPLRNTFDVISYDLNIKVDIQNQSIAGYNDIILKAKAKIFEIQLDLFENLKINSVTKNNESLKVRREGNAFFVSFSEPLLSGQVYKIRVNYEGSPIVAKRAPWDGGFIWAKTKSGSPWVGVACEGLGASAWWPNKDHLSDEPDSMWIRVAVPDSLQNISNGKLKNKVKLGNGYTRWDWLVSYPINNYNVTLNIANYEHFTDIHTHADGEVLAMDYYVIPENLEKAKLQFQQAKTTIKAFEHYFGKYPFYKDGYKLIETPYAGMEHQSAIAYGNLYLPGYWGRHLPGIDFDYIIIHETGHEWWGNKVSCQDIADLWIHEGFCTYSEILYVEYTLGKEAAIVYANNMKKGIDNDKPIIGKYELNDEGSGDMYPKGALMIYTLRNWLNNDTIFFEMIKGIQEEFAYQTVTTRQIENYIAMKTGLKLQSFFNQYLRNATLPELEYYFSGKKKTLRFNYRWNAMKGFELPIEVMVDEKGLTKLIPNNLWNSVATTLKPKKVKIETSKGLYNTVALPNKK